MALNRADFDKVQRIDVADDDGGIRLDRWFKRHVPDLGFGPLSKMLRKGEVRVDGKRADGKTKIEAGQELRIPPLTGRLQDREDTPTPRRLSDHDRQYMRDLVLHEDDDLIVLNKPAGLPTQGGTGITRHLDGLLPALVDKGALRPKLVHRLDKDTSGIILLGKTQQSTAALTKAFRERSATKIYHALVIGCPSPKQGRISQPIEKEPGMNGERMVPVEGGKPAVSLYRTMDVAARSTSFVELQPQTGRTHQLRVHMALIGCPIVGDGKYGGQDAFLTGAISRKMHLHAYSISLAHPSGGMLNVTAAYPPHMVDSLSLLGLEAQEED